MTSSSEIHRIETDVLIIGSGVAGMMAIVGVKRSGEHSTDLDAA